MQSRFSVFSLQVDLTIILKIPFHVHRATLQKENGTNMEIELTMSVLKMSWKTAKCGKLATSPCLKKTPFRCAHSPSNLQLHQQAPLVPGCPFLSPAQRETVWNFRSKQFTVAFPSRWYLEQQAFHKACMDQRTQWKSPAPPNSGNQKLFNGNSGTTSHWGYVQYGCFQVSVYCSGIETEAMSSLMVS